MHEIDNLSAQTSSLHLAISFVDEGARNGNIEVHDTGDVVGIHNRKVLLVSARNCC